MKKIIGAALATSMLAGSAFAADLSFSYSGNNYFNVSGKNFNYAGAERTDCFSVSLSNEKAGVVVDFDTSNSSLVQDQYYAWMTFGLPVGNLQLTSGKWSGIYADDVTTDAGDLDGEDWIYWDMGVLDPNSNLGYDSGNLTYDAAKDANVLSLVAAYTLSDNLPGALLVKGGIVSVAEYDSWKTESNHDASWLSGFVSEVAYRQDGLINVNLAFKNYAKHEASFGLFVSPLMVENLEATLGVTMATDLPSKSRYQTTNANYDRIYDFGIDLRARYQVTDALALTTAHNFTIYDSYDTAATSEATAYDDTFLGMANMIGLSYKMAENLTAKFSLQSHMSQAFEFHAGNTNNCFVDELYFTPSLEIAATEKATVTVASRFYWEDVGNEGNETFNVKIPVIFSYNY